MNHGMCPKAISWIHGGRDLPRLSGMVRFFQSTDGVIVEAEIFGLPETATVFFAFHIHEGGNCTGEGFPNAGSHFNLKQESHPNHAGDLPPLLGNYGKAYMKVLTDRFHIEEVIGRTVFIHNTPDDFHTQPSGNAGEKLLAE